MDIDKSSTNNSRSFSRKRYENKNFRILNLNLKNYRPKSILNISNRAGTEHHRLNQKFSFTRIISSSLLSKKPYLISRKSKNNIKKNIINSHPLLSIQNEYSNSRRVIFKPYKSISTMNSKNDNLSNIKNKKIKFHKYKSSNNLLSNTNEIINNKNNCILTSNNNNSLNFLYSINFKNCQKTRIKKNDDNNNYYFFVNNSINIQKNSIIPKTRIFFHNPNNKNNKINFKTIKNSRSYNTIFKRMKRPKNLKFNQNYSSFATIKTKKSPKNRKISSDVSLKVDINPKKNSNANCIRISKKNITYKKNYIGGKNNLIKSNNNLNSDNITYFNNNINTNIQQRNINKYVINNQKPNKLNMSNSRDNNIKNNISRDRKNSKIKNNNQKIKNNIEHKENKKKILKNNNSHKNTIEISLDNCINKKSNARHPEKTINYNKTDNTQEKDNIILITKNIRKNPRGYKMKNLSNKYARTLDKISKNSDKKIPDETVTNERNNNINNIKTETNDIIISTQIIHNRKINIDKNSKYNNRSNKSKSKSLKDIKKNNSKENVKKIREVRKKKKLLISFKNNNNVKLFSIKEIFSNFCKIDNYNKCKTPNGNKYYNTQFKNFNFLKISKKITKTQQISTEKLFMPTMKDKFQLNKNFLNPQYNFEYINDILENLLIEENNYLEVINMGAINIDDNKFSISPDSRKFFINSLINIQDVLSIKEQTLFLTVQIFDRYINEILAKEGNIIEENLDIVIVCSLIIAAKREEIKLYSMSDYLNLLPEKYSLKDVIEQEFKILKKLNFEILIPNALNFYEIFATKCKFDVIQMDKGLYLLNVALMDSNMLQIPSSLISYCIVKIVGNGNCEGIVDKIRDKYESEGIIKEIKILPVFKDNELIDNLCNFIRYIQKLLKESPFKSVIDKFNTPSRHFVSFCIDL